MVVVVVDAGVRWRGTGRVAAREDLCTARATAREGVRFVQ